MELARNSVLVSNSCGWLVKYYFDHGQLEKATKLADQCAEVYSSRGLWTRGYLYELMGNLKEAEEYYEKVRERYDEPDDLCSFYMLHANENARYKAEAERLEAVSQWIETRGYG